MIVASARPYRPTLTPRRDERMDTRETETRSSVTGEASRVSSWIVAVLRKSVGSSRQFVL